MEMPNWICYRCKRPMSLDTRRLYCPVTLKDEHGRLVTDDQGNPWITMLCATCGHEIGAKTLAELEASGEAAAIEL